MRKVVTILVLMLSLILVLAACGGEDEPAASAAAPAAQAQPAVITADPAHGEELFMSTCIACHGADAKGVQGLGKSLHPSDNEFIRGSSDQELIEFIKVGRQPGDPGNTTGVAMPPKGGNPAISEEDIRDIVAWMRTLE